MQRLATAKSLAPHAGRNVRRIHYPGPTCLATAKSLASHPSRNVRRVHYTGPACLATAKGLALHPGWNVQRVHYPGPPHDVFINHRGIDTKLNLSGLLFHQFSELNLRPFLDIKSMRPGEPLLEKLNKTIRGCKVGWRVLAPLLRVALQVVDDGNYSDMDLQRFRDALEEARDTVGLTFDTVRGDWLKLLKDASDAVIRHVLEVDQEAEVSSTQ
ncbi:hypothetical protein NL676_012890 [Syzygium grande]|nr:hypothetical protein NL676_012890 [Syzygium grande]